MTYTPRELEIAKKAFEAARDSSGIYSTWRYQTWQDFERTLEQEEKPEDEYGEINALTLKIWDEAWTPEADRAVARAIVSLCDKHIEKAIAESEKRVLKRVAKVVGWAGYSILRDELKKEAGE